MAPTAHARLSPSAASRWSECEASVQFIESLSLPASTSDAAEEGTKAHALAEKWLTTKVRPECEDHDMLGYVGVYVAQVLEAYGDFDILHVEHKVPLIYSKGETGTSDAVIVHADGSLTVFDLKYGVGVTVEAEKNKQLALYALGSVFHLASAGHVVTGETPVRLVIVQPRTREGSFRKEWSTTVQELREFIRPVEESAARIVSGRPRDFSPCESACRFCPAKLKCSAFAAAAFDGVPEGDMPITLSTGSTLTVAQLAKLVEAAPKLRALLDAAEEHAEGILIAGGSVPGFKLVAGRRRRSWRSEADAMMALRLAGKRDTEFCDLKLKTPAQAEKLFAKGQVPAAVLAQIDDSPGAPTIAPVSDKREAISVSPKPAEVAMFDDLDDPLS